MSQEIAKHKSAPHACSTHVSPNGNQKAPERVNGMDAAR